MNQIANRYLIVLGLAALLGARATIAAPDGLVYELQERCGQSVEKWFKEEYGNGVQNTKDGQTISGFRNHYNSRLNKCFVLLTSRSFLHKKGEKRAMYLDESLIDFNENNEYGSLVEIDRAVFSCYIRESSCTSRSEWELMIKPYLEE